MRRSVLLFVLPMSMVLVLACKEKPQPAETQTTGNATDRSPVTGTTGTGEPRNVTTESASSATALGTEPIAGPVRTTDVVHAKAQPPAAKKTSTNKKKY
jgi:hypothetical protein